MAGNPQSLSAIRIVKLNVEITCFIPDIIVASKSTLGTDLGQYMQTGARESPGYGVIVMTITPGSGIYSSHPGFT